MIKLKNKRLTIVSGVYWFLLLYIIAALVWWFIALQKQNHQMTAFKILQLKLDDPAYIIKSNLIAEQQDLKTAQYIGEGSIFLLVILFGAIYVYRAVRRQIRGQQQQQNFMMAVTHELKTPIAVARLNMETIQKHDLDRQQQQKFIYAALQEMNRLNTLASNILITSQLEGDRQSLAKEKTSLSMLVQQVAANLSANFTERKWSININPELFVDGDGLLLQLLVSNLIENAIKYSPGNSILTVGLKGNSKKIIFSIGDQGAGIPTSEKKKIFQKFYRIGNEATRSAPGTGLGLYLCKKIAEYHHAEINVSDNIPAGSIFTVTFKALE
jgi:two-component system, OmpR family, sensor histidine kinase CiaH